MPYFIQCSCGSRHNEMNSCKCSSSHCLHFYDRGNITGTISGSSISSNQATTRRIITLWLYLGWLTGNDDNSESSSVALTFNTFNG